MPPILQRPSHDLVDRVVSSDVFAQHQQIAGTVERSGSVQPSSTAKDCLRFTQLFRQFAKQAGWNVKLRIGRPNSANSNRFDAGFPANPATGGGKKVTLHPLGNIVCAGQGGADRVSCCRRWDCFDTLQILAAGNDALGEKESGGQFKVVTRGPHSDADGRFPKPDLQRLFYSQVVLHSGDGSIFPLLYGCKRNVSLRSHRSSAFGFTAFIIPTPRRERDIGSLPSPPGL